MSFLMKFEKKDSLMCFINKIWIECLKIKFKFKVIFEKVGREGGAEDGIFREIQKTRAKLLDK